MLAHFIRRAFGTSIAPPRVRGAGPSSPPAGGPERAAAGHRTERVWRTVVVRRVMVAAVALGVWGVAIEARLVYLQVVQHEEMVSRAERQQKRTVAAPAKRGDIVDRRGNLLAFSVDADSIYAVPTDIQDADRTASTLCGALDGCGERERQTIAERLKRQRAFAFVRRQATPEEARRVAALELEGVGFLKENRRYYPNKELASHVLGYVGIDNTGLNGVESAYDRLIGGRPGTILIQTDARHHAFSRLERPPTAGAGIELTIDQHLQHIAERELRAAVAANRAAGGTVIVMDPQTGEILALANDPTFNPNSFAKYRAEERRNRAIQDIYEPGSTFKMVTASAALEEQVMGVDDRIDVSAGMIRFGARRIHDTHRYGVLSMGDAIVKSSNVGAIKVGLKLGPERLARYVRRFGFGQTLSRDLQGESPGIVWDPGRLNDSSLASVSMGYQVGVTPLQMVTAVSSIANGGLLLEPRIVRAVLRDGRRLVMPRRVLRRTVSRETADQLTTIMEAVVERGTARAARLEGFTAAGKTGTAAKIVAGRYSKSEYNASFIGFVPSRNPVMAILVVIDSPRANGYYGGAVAAPVFKRVAEASLRALAVPSTIDPAPPVLVVQGGAPASAPVPTPVAAPLGPRVPVLAARADVMPDLRGLSAREALRVAARFGLSPRVTGDGIVVEQEPAAGLPVERSATCTLRLQRRPETMPPGGAASP